MSNELKELPEGWCYAFLSELGNLSRGKSKHRPRNDPKLYGEFVPFIQTGEVARSKGRISSFSKMYSEFGVQQSRIFPKGTVCITIAANIADTGILGFDACFPDSVVGLVTDDNLTDPYFVEYFLRTIREDLAQFAPATAQANINLEILNKVSVPIAPLNEQKRIVAKIEELRDRHQRAKQALEAIPELCDRFRQSVLAAAFRGDLTADWREENPDVEPASVFLERASKELKQDLTQVTTEIDRDNGDLPSSWAWAKFKLFVKGIQAGKNFACPEIPVTEDTIGLVKISAVTWGKFNPQETKTVDDSSRIDANLFIQKGDFLISRANTIELIGASVVVDEINHKIMLSDKVWRVNFLEVDKRFINFYLKSLYGRREIESRATGNQLSMRNISQNAFKDIVIALPPLEEQQEIVCQIEALFKGIDLITQQYQDSETLFDRLNQSILAKAFRGELVEQDSNDEPASVLLERIRAEREQEDNGKKTKGKRAKQLKLEV